MFVTTFNAKQTDQKFAWSPYDDCTFIFTTYKLAELDNLRMFNILVSNWVLNIPLSKLTSPTRTFRRKENLEQYFVQGYTIKWNHKRSLRMDVELKYGPDTPEDPVNATITFSGGTAGNGQWGTV